MPFDVRKGCAFPKPCKDFCGYAAHLVRYEKAGGRAAGIFGELSRKSGAFPHIERQSRRMNFLRKRSL